MKVGVIKFHDEEGNEVNLTLVQFKALMHEAVQEVCVSRCRVPLSDDEVKETGHVFGFISDIGGGDTAKGVETMRENHKYLCKIRKHGEKLGSALIWLVLATVAGGTLKALWEGIKMAVGRGN